MDKDNLIFLKTPLTIKEDVILTPKNNVVMMGWETDIMRLAARTICSRGKDILNIGYGMGIIDGFIQEYKPNNHWIIEAHPDIQKKILKNGWDNKAGVKLIFNRWQNVLDSLPKFDGIYIDTYMDNSTLFIKNAHKLLKPNGILSYFTISTKINMKDDMLFNAAKECFNIQFMQLHLKNIPKQDYWDVNNKTYLHPICTLKT